MVKPENWLTFHSRDKHRRRSKHFKLNGGRWQFHGIVRTWGFKFHRDLDLAGSIIISKGMSNEDDGYSVCEGVTDGGPCKRGVPFTDVLRAEGVEEVYVGGLATDYCVKATVLDLLAVGFRVHLILDACRAVNINPEDEASAIEEMRQAGAILTTSAGILKGND